MQNERPARGWPGGPWMISGLIPGAMAGTELRHHLLEPDPAVDGPLPDRPVVEPLGHPRPPGVGPRRVHGPATLPDVYRRGWACRARANR
jgi:hypothetical protein